MIDIKRKQNEEDTLRLFFSARESYNNASKLNNYLWVINVLIGIIGLTNSDKFPKDSKVITLVALYLVTVFLQYLVCRYTKYGANTKEYIDRSLFKFKQMFDSTMITEICDLALKYEKKNKMRYNQQISCNGNSEGRGVKEWYTPKDTDDFDELVFQCQQENIYWDKDLVKVYKRILILISVIIGGGALLYIHLKGGKGLVNIIYAFIPTLYMLGRDWYNVGRYTVYSGKIDEKINLLKEDNAKDRRKVLEGLQKEIHHRRLLLFIVPDLFHRIKSEALHRNWKVLLMGN